MIKILAGGKKNKDWLAEACDEYEKRLRKPFDLAWQFVEESELDSKVLALDKDNFVILLDERGKILSSPELSEKMADAFGSAKNIVFVVGGAFGHFSPEMQARADLILSFSKMVFPHQICRLILAEQIYRAQEIYLGHPYHHA
ncbi:MAG: 23S rRNA (pseudouridine(1915)-N(3))-methyltransferase RlmH [Candidatus Saccharibacteria bacterium]|nr:23S rRNA (pseudouridine(1915)-N(3))-methyltransferase RlmH [Candidatus Saccharibacteria bacterium]